MNINLNFRNMAPVEFLPYSHMVTNTLVSIGDHSDPVTCQFFEDTENDLLEMFKAAGIRAFKDNKCIYVLRMTNEILLYVGFYDWVMNIGFGYRKI